MGIEAGKKQIGVQTPPPIQNPEQELQAILSSVRTYIHQLALREQDPDLTNINVNELGEIDIVLFRRFMLGELTLKDIEQQEMVLVNLKTEMHSALSLLDYMKKKLSLSGLVQH